MSLYDKGVEVYPPKPCHGANLSKSGWPSDDLKMRHGTMPKKEEKDD